MFNTGDAAITRQDKITRFKKQKEIENLLEVYRKRQENNEDVERELVLCWIGSMVQRGFDLWQLVWKEEEMLGKQIDNPHSASLSLDTESINPNTPLLSETGKVFFLYMLI